MARPLAEANFVRQPRRSNAWRSSALGRLGQIASGPKPLAMTKGPAMTKCRALKGIASGPKPLAMTKGSAMTKGPAMTSVRDARHHLAETAIHIGDFGRHARRQIGQQEGRHVAHILDGHIAANRRG
jgi:hypothetical protein